MKRYLFVGAMAVLIISWESLAIGGSYNGSFNGSLNGTMKSMKSTGYSTKVSQNVQSGWEFLDGLSALGPVSDAIDQGSAKGEEAPIIAPQ